MSAEYSLAAAYGQSGQRYRVGYAKSRFLSGLYRARSANVAPSCEEVVDLEAFVESLNRRPDEVVAFFSVDSPEWHSLLVFDEETNVGIAALATRRLARARIIRSEEALLAVSAYDSRARYESNESLTAKRAPEIDVESSQSVRVLVEYQGLEAELGRVMVGGEFQPGGTEVLLEVSIPTGEGDLLLCEGIADRMPLQVGFARSCAPNLLDSIRCAPVDLPAGVVRIDSVAIQEGTPVGSSLAVGAEGVLRVFSCVYSGTDVEQGLHSWLSNRGK
jgi:hypothetical protein